MKKRICIIITACLLLMGLASCNFTKNISGTLAEKAEATPKVTEMMQALAENRASDAKALMHPQIAEASDNPLAQMSAYLAGRGVDDMELTNITINTSAGTSGNVRQEKVVYRVALTDGTVIYLNVVYLSNNQGTGFASFQLVLGVV